MNDSQILLAFHPGSPYYSDALTIAYALQRMINNGLEFDPVIDQNLLELLLELADTLYTERVEPFEDDDFDDEEEDEKFSYDMSLEDDEDPYPEE